MALPDKNSTDWTKEVEFYLASTPEQRDKRAIELGYANRNTYQTVMAREGVLLADKTTDYVAPAANEIPEIHLPPVKLKKYTPINAGRLGDPETMGLLLQDWHTCEITPTYNDDIQDARIDKLFSSTMNIATLHRNLYPVNDLEILVAGDMVQGENPFQGSKVGAVLCGARDQVVYYAFPKLTELILSLKENFVTVNVRCVRGNHGRYSRQAPSTSNWDLMLYDLLKVKLERYGIKVDISDTFYKIVDIQGHRFFMVHLDQFKSTQGVPWFSMTKGIQSWYVTYGGFDYVVGGHFHRDDFLRINSRCKLMMGGPLVTDDEFTQEVIKTSSIPCQWVFGVHKNHGITWSYSLVVDDKYSPVAQRIVT